jgi:hypothetical protein
MTKERAPKGGMTIAGVFYKGGQFLPSDYEPKRGKYNSTKSTAVSKARKVQVAPYTWEVAPEGKRSIFQWVAGTIATMSGQTMVYCGNAQKLAYTGLSESKALDLINKFNSGQRFI